MHDPTPHLVTEQDWHEIAAVPLVRDRWSIPDGEYGPLLKKIVFGAKFRRFNHDLVYEGDLFVLFDAGRCDEPPVVLMRRKDGRRLTVVVS